MGLGDFLQNILGGKNTFSAQPMQLDKTDYNQSIDAAQKAAIAGLNTPTETGKMQTDLAQQLMAQSQGQGPSLAQMQLQQASDQNLKNQAGLIASQRGMNPAQAARAVALQGAAQGQNLANQSAQLRLNEQLQKQQLLQQALQGQRGLDINQIQANTGLLGTSGQDSLRAWPFSKTPCLLWNWLHSQIHSTYYWCCRDCCAKQVCCLALISVTSGHSCRPRNCIWDTVCLVGL